MKQHFRSHGHFPYMIVIFLLALSLSGCAQRKNKDSAANSENLANHTTNNKKIQPDRTETTKNQTDHTESRFKAEGNDVSPDFTLSMSNDHTPSGRTDDSKNQTTAPDVSASTLYSKYHLTYTDSTGYSLPYCLYLPKKEAFPEDSEKTSYPLVLFLHGAGERGDDNELQNNDTGIVPRLTDETFYAAHPCIIVAPQCPADAQWVDTPWTEGSYSIEETPISPALSAVSELLDNICAQYPADTSRLYITGVSMGGYGAWDLLLRRPTLFAGGIVLCGAGDPSRADAIAHIPLRLFHGAKDTEVPVSGSRDMYQALEDAGATDVQYKEYPDIGHWMWLNAWEEPGLLDWLFSVSQ